MMIIALAFLRNNTPKVMLIKFWKFLRICSSSAQFFVKICRIAVGIFIDKSLDYCIMKEENGCANCDGDIREAGEQLSRITSNC